MSNLFWIDTSNLERKLVTLSPRKVKSIYQNLTAHVIDDSEISRHKLAIEIRRLFIEDGITQMDLPDGKIILKTLLLNRQSQEQITSLR